MQIVWPIGLISYILITGLMLTMRNATISITYTPVHLTSQAKQRIGIYLALFLLCLLTVLHVLHYLICLAVILVAVFLVDLDAFQADRL